MGDLGRRLGRRGYLIRLALSVGLFAASGLLFPVVAIPFLALEGCWPDGARANCTGILSMVVAAIYFPLVGLVFIVSLVRPLMDRSRDIGINPWLGLLPLALMLVDYKFLMVGTALMGSVLAGGSLGAQRPDFLLEGLALMVAIGCVPPREGQLVLRDIGWPLWLAAGLAALMGVRLMPSALWAYPLAWAGLFAMLLLPFTLAYALWPRAGESDVREPADALRPPVKQLAWIAAGLTLAVLVVTQPGMLNPLGIGINLMSTVLPTFALYFAVVLTGYLWLEGRRWQPAVLTLILTVVFGGWAYQHFTYQQGFVADAQRSAALSTGIPANRPTTVFVEGRAQTQTMRQELLKRADISLVVERERDGTLLGYRRSGVRGKGFIETPVTQLPARYLHVKMSTVSSYYEPGSSFRDGFNGNGPYELRLVAGGDDSRAVVWISRMRMRPLALPVLSTDGWAGSGGNNDAGKLIRAFIVTALGEGAPAPLPK